MRPFVAALALSIVAALSTAHADYVRIVYNLGGDNSTPSGVVASGPSSRSKPKSPGSPGTPSVPGAPDTGPPLGIPGLPSILEKLLPKPEPEDDPEDSNLEAAAVIEYHKTDIARFIGEGGLPIPYHRIHHKWGATCLTPNLADIRVEFVTEEGVKLPTVAQRYKMQRESKLKEDTNNDGILELAEWALNHADIAKPIMLDQFDKLMGELHKLDADHRVTKAFEQVQAGLDASLSADHSAIAWKDRLGYRVKRSDHYALLYATADYEPAAVDLYLSLLEENFRGFFYWFALKGYALPVPKQRLVAVLVNKSEEFHAYRQAFDDADLFFDGFYSPYDNLVVFCASRLDDTYNLLVKTTSPLWVSGWNLDDLIKGRGHPGARSTDEVIKNQMLALLQKALAEESARASVGHVGVRQLLVSTGLINPRVDVPDWLPCGIASFFETPTGAYWPGIGAPHWQYMVRFKLWERYQKLDRPEDAIHNVLTDGYFQLAREKNKKSLTTKARTMSWGLAYFLLNRKPDGVFRLLDELNNLPRDMALDDETLMLCFGRAFDLVEPADPDRVNPMKLYKLADEWYSFIDLTPMESSEALQDAFRRYKQYRGKY
jgi:hypothetical protein